MRKILLMSLLSLMAVGTPALANEELQTPTEEAIGSEQVMENLEMSSDEVDAQHRLFRCYVRDFSGRVYSSMHTLPRISQAFAMRSCRARSFVPRSCRFIGCRQAYHRHPGWPRTAE